MSDWTKAQATRLGAEDVTGEIVVTPDESPRDPNTHDPICICTPHPARELCTKAMQANGDTLSETCTLCHCGRRKAVARVADPPRAAVEAVERKPPQIKVTRGEPPKAPVQTPSEAPKPPKVEEG